MKYDGILFDLDGTLWNATKAIEASWKIALSDAADIKAAPTTEDLEKVMGMTAEDLMATLFPYISEERGLELFDICCQVENKYLLEHGGQLYPGIQQLIKSLSEKLPIFIVSNCNLDYIPCFLKAHGFEGYFKDWECIGRTGKQKWENIQLVVQRNGLTHPVYIGDTDMDYRAAAKAGVPFIHAAYGFGKVEGVTAIQMPSQLIGLLD